MYTLWSGITGRGIGRLNRQARPLDAAAHFCRRIGAPHTQFPGGSMNNRPHGFRWLVAGALGLIAAGAFALDAPEKAELDKPAADFKLKDLAYEAKPKDKEEAALVALSGFK